MRVIVLGGTGFIGRALCLELVDRGHEVVVPSRSPAKVGRAFGGRVAGAAFDGLSGQGLAALLDRESAVVNLVGENIAAGRWTLEKKRRILDSRLDAGKAVVEAVDRAAVRPKVLVQGSAVGFYGPRGDEEVLEDQPAGAGFLADVTERWEASTRAVEDMGVRRAVVRTAMVLGPGGALERMLPAFRMGLGGPLGSGRQHVSWIHLRDEVGAIRHLIEDPEAGGPYNLAAPHPATSRAFAAALGQALRRPAVLPAPAFALKLLFGEMAEQVLLSGQRAVPARLLASGYLFAFPELAAALRDAIAA